MKQVRDNSLIPFDNEAMTFIDGDAGHDVDVRPVSRVWYRMVAAGEGHQPYRYFKMYLQMEQPRNVTKLAKHLRLTTGALGKYSSEFKWVDRAGAYDDWNSDRVLTRLRQQQELRERLWAERRDHQREQEWDIAQALLDKVREMLSVPLFTETVTEMLKGIDPDGRIIIEQVIRYEPLDWGATDMARFFDVASKMARLATGMDTDQKKIRIDVSALTDDELERLAASK